MKCVKCAADDWVGFEDPDVFDGVVFWICQPCGWSRPREFHGAVARTLRSYALADRRNRALKAQHPGRF